MFGNGMAQQNLAMMQAQMGSMGGMGLYGNTNAGGSMFFFSGNVIALQSRLDDAKNQPTPIVDVNISVFGNQIKQHNIGCMMLTVLCGSIIIIPLFFMCCGWWKKMVSPAYNVPLSTYQKLQALINSSSIKSVTLMVLDSTFDQIKAKLLYDMLSRSSLKGFNFINVAPPNNYNSNQWSDFKEHMKPIKILPIMSDIKWNDQIVL